VKNKKTVGCGLLRFIAVEFGEKLTFRREILTPSAGSKSKPSKKLLFDPEDGGSIFPQNFGLSPSYTAFLPRRQYPSLLPT
jgi:hypothetical protein